MSGFSRMNIVVNKIISVSHNGLFCDTEEENIQEVCYITVKTSNGTVFSINERDGELQVMGRTASNYNIKVKNGVLTIKPLED